MAILSRVIARFRPDPVVELQKSICAEYDRAVAIAQPSLPDGPHLPECFGRGLPERTVEILLARLSYRAGARVLDIGHANAMMCHLHMIGSLPEPKHLAGVDLAEAAYDTSEYYEQSLVADATRVPMPDGSRDLIWAISAIEHFGMDNSGYVGTSARTEDHDVRAVHEMIRLLSDGGTALITVPYGRYQDHDWFRQYDCHRWQSLLDAARSAADCFELYFRHTTEGGWRPSLPKELVDVRYHDENNSGAAAIAVAYVVKRAG